MGRGCGLPEHQPEPSSEVARSRKTRAISAAGSNAIVMPNVRASPAGGERVWQFSVPGGSAGTACCTAYCQPWPACTRLASRQSASAAWPAVALCHSVAELPDNSDDSRVASAKKNLALVREPGGSDQVGKQSSQRATSSRYPSKCTRSSPAYPISYHEESSTVGTIWYGRLSVSEWFGRRRTPPPQYPGGLRTGGPHPPRRAFLPDTGSSRHLPSSAVPAEEETWSSVVQR